MFSALARTNPDVRAAFEHLAARRALWNFLRLHSSFAELPDEGLAQLVDGLERVHAAAGRIVVVEGDPPGGIFVIAEGRARVSAVIEKTGILRIRVATLSGSELGRSEPFAIVTSRPDHFLVSFPHTAVAGDPFPVRIANLIEALMQSPNFLFRTELGAPSGKSEIVGLTAFETAAALSYYAWRAPPDDELLELADSGALLAPDTLAAQARRLFADPRARTTIVDFVTEWLHFGDEVELVEPGHERRVEEQRRFVLGQSHFLSRR